MSNLIEYNPDCLRGVKNAEYIEWAVNTINRYGSSFWLERYFGGNYYGTKEYSAAYKIARNKVWDDINNYYDLSFIGSKDGALDRSLVVFVVIMFVFDNAGELLKSDKSEVQLLAKLGMPAAILVQPFMSLYKETNY